MIIYTMLPKNILFATAMNEKLLTHVMTRSMLYRTLHEAHTVLNVNYQWHWNWTMFTCRLERDHRIQP